jgi:hypothetical protein
MVSHRSSMHSSQCYMLRELAGTAALVWEGMSRDRGHEWGDRRRRALMLAILITN